MVLPSDLDEVVRLGSGIVVQLRSGTGPPVSASVARRWFQLHDDRSRMPRSGPEHAPAVRRPIRITSTLLPGFNQSCMTTGWRRPRGDRVMECRRRPQDLDLDGQPDERALCCRHQSGDDEHQGNAPEGRSKHDEWTPELARGSRAPEDAHRPADDYEGGDAARYEPQWPVSRSGHREGDGEHESGQDGRNCISPCKASEGDPQSRSSSEA
jgi:hypothetical protein